MSVSSHGFDEHEVIKELKHYLPSQAPLKDFVHHNTLHAFQHSPFHEGVRMASCIFGYHVYLKLQEYRDLFERGKIDPAILDKMTAEKKGASLMQEWKIKLIHEQYDYKVNARIGKLRELWKTAYRINPDKEVHSLLLRVLGAYLDQGISIWNFPITSRSFLDSLREMEKSSFNSLFRSKKTRKLFLETDCELESLLEMLVGNKNLYATYLFDQQFSHPGWSGMVSVLEDQPSGLLDKRNICLKDFIVFELLLEIDALNVKYNDNWEPFANKIKEGDFDLFSPPKKREYDEVIALWQEIYEWSLYDKVLYGLSSGKSSKIEKKEKTFQALFCIDDRECSNRRYVEAEDPNAETFSTAGFFNAEFYYQPENGKFITKHCPAPLDPKYLIKEIGSKTQREDEAHFKKQTHHLIRGWIISQTLGFWSAFRLFLDIFRPTVTPETVSSFRHMDKGASLTVLHDESSKPEHGLQVGYKVVEMADRVEGLLKSIGLVKDFAPFVYLVGHGASSVNNTHYAGYDCGACCGRPGSVNARVASFMANHVEVRRILAERGISIPDKTKFVGALHDTTRDEIEFYEEDTLSKDARELHEKNKAAFQRALKHNAKERARRFVLLDKNGISPEEIHERVKLRSVSLFEPRPELNHATNALCIVGRREMTKDLFLDRRAFLNSYDYTIDPDAKYLSGIMKALAPVCGGINLEYYFSRTDNFKLGAGTKLPHNVIGLIGVANGIDGDLRTGLPEQMIEVHDPKRLLIAVEHFPEAVLKAIHVNDATYEWFENEWIHLAVILPETKEILLFKKGEFTKYTTVTEKLAEVENVDQYVSSSEDNLPVSRIKKKSDELVY